MTVHNVHVETALQTTFLHQSEPVRVSCLLFLWVELSLPLDWSSCRLLLSSYLLSE